MGKSLGDISTVTTDYRARIRDTTDLFDREASIRMVSLKRLAVTANKNLDDVFKALFGKVVP